MWEDIANEKTVTIHTALGEVRIEGMAGLTKLCREHLTWKYAKSGDRFAKSVTFAAAEAMPDLAPKYYREPGPELQRARAEAAALKAENERLRDEVDHLRDKNANTAALCDFCHKTHEVKTVQVVGGMTIKTCPNIRPHEAFALKDPTELKDYPVWPGPQPLYGIEPSSGKALRTIQEFNIAEMERTRAAWEKAVEPLVTKWIESRGMYLKAPRVEESGPGLAAKYPDATPAAKPTQEPVTCDLGADWED